MKKHKSFRVSSIALLLLALATGCSSLLRRADVLGTYRCRFDEGTAELVLKGDGSFEQTFKDSRNRVQFNNGGTWSFDKGIDPRIELKHYRLVHNHFGDFDPNFAENTAGNYAYPVNTWFGHIYLTLQVDEERHFDKVQ